jgi:hypothetical protein
MSWKVLTDESKKIKREKKRKRKIKRGSKRGRYIVLGSRARAGRKSAIHCVTCGNTLPVHTTGDICRSCETETERKVGQVRPPMSQMEIPEMTGGK